MAASEDDAWHFAKDHLDSAIVVEGNEFNGDSRTEAVKDSILEGAEVTETTSKPN